MARAVATPGVSVHALEIRLNLEGKSLDAQVQVMLDMFRVKFEQLGRVYDVEDVEKLKDE